MEIKYFSLQKKLFKYGFLIIIGIVMAISALVKLLKIVNFSSDWFWFIAAMGLIIEGVISLIKEKKFNDKFLIIKKGSKEHEKLLFNK